ncbi:MAG: tyrosine--tRNA ligase [Planctomycetota bacterium]|nr:tyrosine--tRNA ligase [Planctomycetota bacterium]
MTPEAGFLDELAWRGMLHQTTDDDGLPAFLSAPGRIAYCGFDPTGSSLTIGNFVAIKLLAHWQRCGHTPIVLMGGGTGLIGDPSGKDAERQLLDAEQVQANVDSCRRIFERVLDFDPAKPNAARIVNNADWLCGLGYIDMLRDVGKHFSVNMMIQKDSVRDRLENREQGISYTEFSYMILQAYDFLHLRRSEECTVQIAGSDQYGNIVAGIDLIRREFVEQGDDVPRGYGITAPLITKADGTKFGKTESGAVWLTADRTSPYAFHQFWLNTSDADVGKYLRWFTFLSREEIEDLEARHAESPQQRLAQNAVADEMTRLMHGEDELERARAAAGALFSGDVAGLDEGLLDEVFVDVAGSDHRAADLEGEGVLLLDLLPETSLAGSKREAREFLSNGSISINGAKVDKASALDRRLGPDDLLHGRMILVRRGKKTWHATRWS